MIEDPRTSRQPVSEVLIVASGDAGATQTILELNDEQTFVLTDYVIHYSDSATTGPINAEVHDTDSGDAIGDTNEGNAIVLEELNNDERFSEDGIVRREFESDVVAVTDRDGTGQDDDMFITVGGYYLSQ